MKIRSKSGLTMLEIVIGLFVVAVAFIPLFRVMQFGGKSTVKINNYSKVARLAQKLIEECKHVPFKVYLQDYGEMAAADTFVVNQNYYPKTLEAIEAFRSEVKSLNIETQISVKKTPDNRVSEVWIQVKATWKEGDGSTQGDKVREIRLGNAIVNPDCYM